MTTNKVPNTKLLQSMIKGEEVQDYGLAKKKQVKAKLFVKKNNY